MVIYSVLYPVMQTDESFRERHIICENKGGLPTFYEEDEKGGRTLVFSTDPQAYLKATL